MSPKFLKMSIPLHSSYIKERIGDDHFTLKCKKMMYAIFFWPQYAIYKVQIDYQEGNIKLLQELNLASHSLHAIEETQALHISTNKEKGRG